jgi:hypothetical protein
MKVWGLEEYRQWHTMSDEQVEQYYRANYEGKTWQQLGVLDPSLRLTLKKRGLKRLVPDPNPRRDWRPMSDDDVMGYLSDTYPGAYREDIRHVDNSLYNQLRMRGLLERVPYRSPRTEKPRPRGAPRKKARKPGKRLPKTRMKPSLQPANREDRFETEEYKSDILKRIAALKKRKGHA